MAYKHWQLHNIYSILIIITIDVIDTYFNIHLSYIKIKQVHLYFILTHLYAMSLCVTFAQNFMAFTEQENTKKRKHKTAYRNRPLTKNHVLPCARFNSPIENFTIPKHFFKLLQLAAQLLNVFVLCLKIIIIFSTWACFDS